MRHALPVLCLLVAVCGGHAAGAPVVIPFERETWPVTANGVDTRVLDALQKAGVEPAYPCSDEVFIRRVHLDVIGTLPEPRTCAASWQTPTPTSAPRSSRRSSSATSSPTTGR